MPYARSLLIVLALLANTVHAGALEDDPRWKTCMENGGTLRSCAPQVLGADAPVATLGTPRTFTPGGGLTAAQQSQVTNMINGNGTVQSALWYGQDARARGIINSGRIDSVNSTANTALWYGQDARSRAINAQNRADQAASWTYYGAGHNGFSPYWGCPPGYRAEFHDGNQGLDRCWRN